MRLFAAPNVFVTASARLSADRLWNGRSPGQERPSWSSDDWGVTTVNQDGEIVGRSPGTTFVRADMSGRHTATRVTVEPRNDDAVEIIAHRGFMRKFPENTLVAVQGAFDNAADAVEVDIRLSRDSIPVVMHDETVDRTTNGHGAVKELTLAQLTALNACARASGTWPACPVPRMDQVLTAAHGRGGVLLHLYGTYTRDDLRKLLKAVHDADMERSTIFICFDYPTLQMLRELDAVVPLGYLSTGLALLDQVDALGRAAALPELQAALTTAARSRDYLSDARRRRVDAGVWVTIDQAQAKAAVALGFRHLISDVPIDRSQLGP
jgi:glycerophosphoryl diester phosphodiesterase